MIVLSRASGSRGKEKEINDMNNYYYEKVFDLTKTAKNLIDFESDGYYKGYAGANAVSLYLGKEYGINVNCDDEAQRAFNDAMQQY